jgi:alkanesulfonate monooxygenase SsuD/methylene tetrahydromethanopterin reductase-like flavin-dependent oxidoreductase (luciferase family)
MEFGVCIPNKIDETGIAAYAENLGYSHAWITDTQMIYSDCWATLALVAQQTRTIKVGPGVAIAPTRLAPVTANAIATINRLAPGRTFLGVGTGNTSMRLIGQPPMKIDESPSICALCARCWTASAWTIRTAAAPRPSSC